MALACVPLGGFRLESRLLLVIGSDLADKLAQLVASQGRPWLSSLGVLRLTVLRDRFIES